MARQAKLENVLHSKQTKKERIEQLHREIRLLEQAEKHERQRMHRQRMHKIMKLYEQSGLTDTNLDSYPDVLLGAFLHISATMNHPEQRQAWHTAGLRKRADIDAAKQEVPASSTETTFV